MDVPAPQSQPDPVGPFTVERYFRLVDEGLLEPEDRVELLEGVVVAMAPQSPPHASSVARVSRILTLRVGERAVVRTQLSFIAGPYSVPEPDVAIVPGTFDDYDHAHPRTALLIVEVADGSLKQDRLTKTSIYAAAAVPEYWIANVRGQQVEVHRSPDPKRRRYDVRTVARRGEALDIMALPGTTIDVDDLLPKLAR